MIAAATLPLAAATLRILSVPIQPRKASCHATLGDGLSWNRPSNYTLWYELAGKNAGIDSAWTTVPATVFQHRNHTQQYILPAVERAGAQRGDVFVVSKIPCGGYDGGEPMTTALAESYVAQVLAELGTNYVDLLLLHHVCTTKTRRCSHGAYSPLRWAAGRRVPSASPGCPTSGGCSASRRSPSPQTSATLPRG